MIQVHEVNNTELSSIPEAVKSHCAKAYTNEGFTLTRNSFEIMLEHSSQIT